MKQGWMIALVFCTLLWACEKENSVACLKGRVVRVTCASTVVEVLNSGSIGEDGWMDSFGTDTPTYSNVFTVSNTCELNRPLVPGDEFWFSVGPASVAKCELCEMLDNAPKTKYSITNISDKPCTVD